MTFNNEKIVFIIFRIVGIGVKRTIKVKKIILKAEDPENCFT